MRILCIGDVVSKVGRNMLYEYVEDLKYKKNIDICIANGENSSVEIKNKKRAIGRLLRDGW